MDDARARVAEGAPLETPVTQDQFILLGPQGSLELPMWAMPPYMNNHGNYIASLGNVCRWLAGQAEALGVEIYPGMAASAPVFEGDTLWAESEILDRRESASNPSVGIVSMRCRGLNQRGEVVIEFKRTFMVYKREAPEAAASFPETDAEWGV